MQSGAGGMVVATHGSLSVQTCVEVMTVSGGGDTELGGPWTVVITVVVHGRTQSGDGKMVVGRQRSVPVQVCVVVVI